jgi:HSP20 family molecular chaperone IbpA
MMARTDAHGVAAAPIESLGPRVTFMNLASKKESRMTSLMMMRPGAHFEPMFNLLEAILSENVQRTVSGYPKYDIVALSDGTARVDVACAGFRKEELEVLMEDGRLVVNGKPSKGVAEPAPEAEESAKAGEQVVSDTPGTVTERYVVRGIARRGFSLSLKVQPGTRLASGSYRDGILSIGLHIDRPEPQRLKLEG